MGPGGSNVALVRESDKLPLGQNVNVKVSHAVTALMNSQGHKWPTSTRMTHHQGLLCENHRVRSVRDNMCAKPSHFPAR